MAFIIFPNHADRPRIAAALLQQVDTRDPCVPSRPLLGAITVQEPHWPTVCVDKANMLHLLCTGRHRLHFHLRALAVVRLRRPLRAPAVPGPGWAQGGHTERDRPVRPHANDLDESSATARGVPGATHPSRPLDCWWAVWMHFEKGTVCQIEKGTACQIKMGIRRLAFPEANSQPFLHYNAGFVWSSVYGFWKKLCFFPSCAFTFSKRTPRFPSCLFVAEVQSNSSRF